MTIKDIARLSGFGISTVSRALNDHPDVSEETKEKIRKIVEEHRFVPNANAKQLKQQISNSIAILVKGSFNMFFASIIERMQSDISKAGYTAIIHYLDERENEVRIAEQLCRERKPQGIIFLGGNTETFKKRFSNITIPCVLSTTSAETLQFKNLSSVCVDDIKCAEQAVDYLFDNGHNKIGIIGGEFDLTNTSGLRLKGCQRSFEKHGLVLDDSCFCQSHYSLQEAYEKTKQMLNENKEITAFFAMSDMMAFGAISAINDLGLKVPEDISVIGFDGIELTGYYCPKLTTMRQPCEQIASKSIRMLLRSIQGDEPSCHTTLDIEFVQGESVRSLL